MRGRGTDISLQEHKNAARLKATLITLEVNTLWHHIKSAMKKTIIKEQSSNSSAKKVLFAMMYLM